MGWFYTIDPNEMKSQDPNKVFEKPSFFQGLFSGDEAQAMRQANLNKIVEQSRLSDLSSSALQQQQQQYLQNQRNQISQHNEEFNAMTPEQKDVFKTPYAYHQAKMRDMGTAQTFGSDITSTKNFLGGLPGLTSATDITGQRNKLTGAQQTGQYLNAYGEGGGPTLEAQTAISNLGIQGLRNLGESTLFPGQQKLAMAQNEQGYEDVTQLRPGERAAALRKQEYASKLDPQSFANEMYRQTQVVPNELYTGALGERYKQGGLIGDIGRLPLTQGTLNNRAGNEFFGSQWVHSDPASPNWMSYDPVTGATRIVPNPMSPMAQFMNKKPTAGGKQILDLPPTAGKPAPNFGATNLPLPPGAPVIPPGATAASASAGATGATGVPPTAMGYGSSYPTTQNMAAPGSVASGERLPLTANGMILPTSPAERPSQFAGVPTMPRGQLQLPGSQARATKYGDPTAEIPSVNEYNQAYKEAERGGTDKHLDMEFALSKELSKEFDVAPEQVGGSTSYKKPESVVKANLTDYLQKLNAMPNADKQRVMARVMARIKAGNLEREPYWNWTTNRNYRTS